MNNERIMFGADLTLSARVHDIKHADKGPSILVLQVLHGKDKKTDQFKPTSFFELKVWNKNSDSFLSVNPKKGDHVKATAWGSTDQWIDKDGMTKRKLVWTLKDIEVVERYIERMARKDPAGDIVIDPDDIPF